MPEKYCSISLKSLVDEAVKYVLEGKRTQGNSFIGIVFQGDGNGIINTIARDITRKLLSHDPPLPSQFDNLSFDDGFKDITYYSDLVRGRPRKCFLVYDPRKKLISDAGNAYFINLDGFDLYPPG